MDRLRAAGPLLSQRPVSEDLAMFRRTVGVPALAGLCSRNRLKPVLQLTLSWLGLAAFVCSSAAAGEPAPVVIESAALFDPVALKMLPERTIIVEAGKIKAVLQPGQEVR